MDYDRMRDQLFTMIMIDTFTISSLSQKIGISRHTLSKYIFKGIMPKSKTLFKIKTFLESNKEDL